MPAARTFPVINRTKADFSTIYVQPDPRAYFRELGGLDYVIPHLAQPVFRQLIDARVAAKQAPITVLDLGCSYGVNGALMKYPLVLDQLQERYLAAGLRDASSDDLAELDRHYFRSWPACGDVRVIGLDSSAPAVAYAERCGAIDYGIVADLESGDLAPKDAEAVAEVDLIVSTGCVGYVTNRTFDKLAACCRNGVSPWVASFVLRMFSYDQIAAALACRGLGTEKFEGATFIQRRFRDEAEMTAALAAVRARGLRCSGKEDAGLLHAELFVSRPPEQAETLPINSLLSIASGANRRYGPPANRGRQAVPA